MDSVHASIQFERAFSGILSFNKKKMNLMLVHGTSRRNGYWIKY
jgi:hypothetical protein